MYYLKTSVAFDSAHFLKHYNGKCANIHGHRWVVEAEVSSPTLQENTSQSGMVIDFGDLKKVLKELADSFDHTLIYETDTLKPTTRKALLEESFALTEVSFRPTAENFARYFFEQLKAEHMPVSAVTVYETPNNCACYREEKPLC